MTGPETLVRAGEEGCVCTSTAAGVQTLLKDCAEQLAVVFTRIFKRSLAQSTIPPCLKPSIIVPLPKKSNISSLSDYHPAALTLIVTRCFEKVVRKHITTHLPPTFDEHQFAYRANRSLEDTIATTLHTSKPVFIPRLSNIDTSWLQPATSPL